MSARLAFIGFMSILLGLSHHAQAQQSSIDALLERSRLRQQESTTPQTSVMEEPQFKQENNTTIEVKSRPKLSLKPTISIPEITVPSFNEESWDGIEWWNDTVGRQITSLLSKMIVQTGDISVRDEINSKYVLKTEITSYKETEEKTREGGVSFFWVVGVKGGRTKVQSLITLNAQIIDTATNDIIHETSIQGEAQRDGKGGGGFLNLGIINITGEGSNEDIAPPIEEAVRITLEKTTNYVRCVLVEKNSCLQDYNVLPLDL